MQAHFRRRGFTLLEILITMALFLILGTILVSMILSGIRKYEQGKLSQIARKEVTRSLNVMQQDISKAIVLPSRGTDSTSGEGNEPVPSGIIYPDPCYDSPPDTLPTNPDDDNPNPSPTNRLIVVVSNKDLDEQRFESSSTAEIGENMDLRYVEYIVNNNEPNKLYRRLYAVKESINGYDGFICNGQRWELVDSFFSDSNMVDYNNNALQPQVVVELPGEKDKIEFWVLRERLPNNQQDVYYGVWGDRNVVNLRVKITMYWRNRMDVPIKYYEDTKAMVTSGS